MTNTATITKCEARVELVAGRYPFRPVCSCGEQFWGYVAEHAAQSMVDSHLNPKPYPHIYVGLGDL